MGKTKKKGGEWFTKKEVTTPLQILNKLLELPKEKELKFNPLVDTSEKEKADRKKKDEDDQKKISKEQSDSDVRRTESEARLSESDKKSDTPKITSSTEKSDTPKIVYDTKADVDIPIEFGDIEKKYQDYLQNLIPQLNKIYTLIVTPEKSDVDENVGENVVRVTRMGVNENENRVIEESSNIYVPEYIPSISST